ncbi:MAG: VCBS repeat-containing protein, partial [Bacteroidetes bacterium]|nr:VCBS repeat-containing protein [Bacteroidota bacterium]
MKNSLILMLIILGSSVAFSQTFTDIAASAGVDGGADWQGVSFADFDNDGDEDIFIVRHDGPPGALYRNNGDGTFTDITNSAGLLETENEGGVFGDYNNDGLLDLYVSNEHARNFLFRNNGDETFSEIAWYSGVAASDWSWGALLFDADNDGYRDLYVCTGIYQDVTNQDFIDFFAGEVVQKMALTGEKEDIEYVISRMPSNMQFNRFFHNNQDLTFSETGITSGFNKKSFSNGAAYGDLDNDGDLDLFVANTDENSLLFSNNGDGTFTKITTGIIVNDAGGSTGASWGDYDNDGYLDLFVANGGELNEDNFLYSNNRDGTFSKILSGNIVNDGGLSSGC